jgi:hypothetical protein
MVRPLNLVDNLLLVAIFMSVYHIKHCTSGLWGPAVFALCVTCYFLLNNWNIRKSEWHNECPYSLKWQYRTKLSMSARPHVLLSSFVHNASSMLCYRIVTLTLWSACHSDNAKTILAWQHRVSVLQEQRQKWIIKLHFYKHDLPWHRNIDAGLIVTEGVCLPVDLSLIILCL